MSRRRKSLGISKKPKPREGRESSKGIPKRGKLPEEEGRRNNINQIALVFLLAALIMDVILIISFL